MGKTEKGESQERKTINWFLVILEGLKHCLEPWSMIHDPSVLVQSSPGNFQCHGVTWVALRSFPQNRHAKPKWNNDNSKCLQRQELRPLHKGTSPGISLPAGRSWKRPISVLWSVTCGGCSGDSGEGIRWLNGIGYTKAQKSPPASAATWPCCC